MSPRAHSEFPASASGRLLSCLASFDASRVLDTGERRSSIYAAEGTLAHSLAEVCLRSGVNAKRFVGQTRQCEGYEFYISDAFADAVQVYVDFARGLSAMGYQLRLETRVTPSIQWPDLDPLPIDLFGTSDLSGFMWAGAPQRKWLIGDLKFGSGVPVEVSGNSQFLYYAAGVIPLDALPDDEVELVVIQPRRPHVDGLIRVATYTVREVREWARDVLYPGVLRAVNDKGRTFNPGSHCRWCPASVSCKALRDYATETARRAFLAAPMDNLSVADLSFASGSKPSTTDTTPTAFRSLTDDQLGDLMDRIAVVRPWMDAVLAHGEERLAAGRDVKNWRRVPKAARRAWLRADDQETIQELLGVGLSRDKIIRAELLSPAQVEKNIGRKQYADLVAPLVSKNSSGFNIVPEGDPRARLRGRTAREAFGIAATQQQDHEQQEG